MLSTTDNPYSPFTEWRQWMAWDEAAGYHTLAYLGRVVRSSHELSEGDEQQAIDDAIDEIIEYNLYGVHTRVTAPKVEEKL